MVRKETLGLSEKSRKHWPRRVLVKEIFWEDTVPRGGAVDPKLSRFMACVRVEPSYPNQLTQPLLVVIQVVLP